jgi:predicted RNase H-like HicB family nuclease
MNRMKKRNEPKPFRASAASLAAAREALGQYSFLIEPDEEVGYAGSAVEMPTVMADGATRHECVENLEFALETVLATLAEDGKPLPEPVSSTTRTEQVNVRLTTREKQLLLLESNRRGYRGISDLVRSRVLDEL